MNKIPLHFSQLAVSLDKIRGVSKAKMNEFILCFTQLAVSLQENQEIFLTTI